MPRLATVAPGPASVFLGVGQGRFFSPLSDARIFFVMNGSGRFFYLPRRLSRRRASRRFLLVGVNFRVFFVTSTEVLFVQVGKIARFARFFVFFLMPASGGGGCFVSFVCDAVTIFRRK